MSYVKVINPSSHGRVAYDNSGSARRCASYLEQEAKEAGGQATFFSSEGSPDRTAAQVVEMLDGNVKGLRKEEAKFHSLVLAPSPDELLHIGNNVEALQAYTRNVMEIYARNFKLKGGRELGEKELVWAATLHHERKNRGTDEGPQGEAKPGLQTHIHVMVSARDADQKVTLNPLGQANRFNRVEFQARTVVQFEEQFQFGKGQLSITAAPTSREARVAQTAQEIKAGAAGKKQLTPEQMAVKDARLDVQVARANAKLPATHQLDPERVKEIAKATNYDKLFYTRLGQLERQAEARNPHLFPYEYLHHNRNEKGKSEPEPRLASQLPSLKPIPKSEKTFTNDYTHTHLNAVIAKLSAGLRGPGRTQDVRSEEEKRRDQEMEM